jgi:hypothetical protein
MGITGRLYDEIGGFDCGLDSGAWCLKDYSRRADHAGFRTLSVDGPAVLYRDEVLYGSTIRRERLLNSAVSQYAARWGEDKTYCLTLSKDEDEPAIERIFEEILERARQGSRFFILAPHGVYGGIVRSGRRLLHGYIEVERLPRFFTTRAVRSAHARIRDRHPDVEFVTDVHALPAVMGENALPGSGRGRSAVSMEV